MWNKEGDPGETSFVGVNSHETTHSYAPVPPVPQTEQAEQAPEQAEQAEAGA